MWVGGVGWRADLVFLFFFSVETLRMKFVGARLKSGLGLFFLLFCAPESGRSTPFVALRGRAARHSYVLGVHTLQDAP